MEKKNNTAECIYVLTELVFLCMQKEKNIFLGKSLFYRNIQSAYCSFMIIVCQSHK